MGAEKILLADDDPMIVDALERQLRREGYEVTTALDGEQAVKRFEECPPDLVLLDVMMPKLNGWDVCREIRRQSHVPILMLTARDDEFDRVLGLELGADDYITKPFSARELVARIRANLRRAAIDSTAVPAKPASGQSGPEKSERNGEQPILQPITHLGHISIDRRRYLVTNQGEPVHLSQREFALLIALLDADGAVINRQDLIDQVWGEEWIGDPRTLDVHIRWLREKLENDPGAPQMILTTRGVGYRLVTSDEIEPHG